MSAVVTFSACPRKGVFFHGGPLVLQRALMLLLCSDQSVHRSACPFWWQVPAPLWGQLTSLTGRFPGGGSLGPGPPSDSVQEATGPNPRALLHRLTPGLRILRLPPLDPWGLGDPQGFQRCLAKTRNPGLSSQCKAHLWVCDHK